MRPLAMALLFIAALSARSWASDQPPETERSIIVLIDASVSVVSPRAERQYRSVITQALQSVQGTARLRVGAFAATVELGTWLPPTGSVTTEVDQLLERAELDRFGPSRVWDAIDAALDGLTEELDADVVIVTDGEASGNAKSRAEVIGRAQRRKTRLSFVLPRMAVLAEQTLRRAAIATGGQIVRGYPEYTSDPQRAELRKALGAVLNGVVQKAK